MSDENMISGGEMCIHKVSKREFTYLRTEGSLYPEIDGELEVVILDGDGDEFTLPSEDFDKWFDIPNPRGDRSDFIKALRDGRITREKCTMAISSNQKTEGE